MAETDQSRQARSAPQLPVSIPRFDRANRGAVFLCYVTVGDGVSSRRRGMLTGWVVLRGEWVHVLRDFETAWESWPICNVQTIVWDRGQEEELAPVATTDVATEAMEAVELEAPSNPGDDSMTADTEAARR